MFKASVSAGFAFLIEADSLVCDLERELLADFFMDATFLTPFARGDLGDLQLTRGLRHDPPFSRELPSVESAVLFLPSLGDIGRVVGICDNLKSNSDI